MPAWRQDLFFLYGSIKTATHSLERQSERKFCKVTHSIFYGQWIPAWVSSFWFLQSWLYIDLDNPSLINHCLGKKKTSEKECVAVNRVISCIWGSFMRWSPKWCLKLYFRDEFGDDLRRLHKLWWWKGQLILELIHDFGKSEPGFPGFPHIILGPL